MRKLFAIIAIAIFINIFCFSLAYADSLVPNIELKGQKSADYQTFYLSCLCATNITRKGNILENIEKMRAACRQINVSTVETLSYHCQNNSISLMIEISFDNMIFVRFSSEYLGLETIIHHFSDNSVIGLPNAFYILYREKIYSISENNLLLLFDGIPTRQATMVISSPYAYSEWEDVEIVLFDTYSIK